MPASSGTTTRDFICFFLFWLISLSAIWFPIHKMYVDTALRVQVQRTVRICDWRVDTFSWHLFTLKAIVAPSAGMTSFIWCIVTARAKGVGPTQSSTSPPRCHTEAISVGRCWRASLMSCIQLAIWPRSSRPCTPPLRLENTSYHSGFADCMCRAAATRLISHPARRVRLPLAGLPQLLAVRFTFSIVSFMGIMVHGEFPPRRFIFGEPVWSPIDLLNRFLDVTARPVQHVLVYAHSRSRIPTSLPPNPAVDRPQQVWLISTAFIIAQVCERSSFGGDGLRPRSPGLMTSIARVGPHSS